jgi:hypothetical protein
MYVCVFINMYCGWPLFSLLSVYWKNKRKLKEIILLSFYPSLIFVWRLMRSPCCLGIPKFFVFYAVRVVSKERRRSVLHRTTSLLFLCRLCNLFLVWRTLIALLSILFTHTTAYVGVSVWTCTHACAYYVWVQHKFDEIQKASFKKMKYQK